jgi:hypothetical protein
MCQLFDLSFLRAKLGTIGLDSFAWGVLISLANDPGFRIMIPNQTKGKNMKKAFLVCLSVLVLVAFVPRPAAAKVTFDLGIKGGISFAKTAQLSEGEAEPVSKALIGPVFGGFVAININKTLTFQPEIYFLGQGGVWENDFEGTIFKWEHAAKYIQIPLLAKFHLIQEGKMIPILFMGPSVDFLLSAKEKFWADGVLEYDESFKDYLKSLHFSAVFGGGVEFMMEKLMLVLEVRYCLGLVNTIKDPDPGNSYKYRTLMIMAGVGF